MYPCTVVSSRIFEGWKEKDCLLGFFLGGEVFDSEGEEKKGQWNRPDTKMNYKFLNKTIKYSQTPVSEVLSLLFTFLLYFNWQ